MVVVKDVRDAVTDVHALVTVRTLANFTRHAVRRNTQTSSSSLVARSANSERDRKANNSAGSCLLFEYINVKGRRWSDDRRRPREHSKPRCGGECSSVLAAGLEGLEELGPREVGGPTDVTVHHRLHDDIPSLDAI